MERGAPTGTDRLGTQQLLARLWTMLDPAVDALPADEVLEHLFQRLREHFGASAAALQLDVQDGFGMVGTLALAFESPGSPTPDERVVYELVAPRASGAR